MVDELKPTPRYRRALRISWSVAWGVLAVVLCVLWVRSYWTVDGFLTQSSSSELSGLNKDGQLRFAWLSDLSDRTYGYQQGWHRVTHEGLWQNNHIRVLVPESLLVARSSMGVVVWISHWLAILLAVSIAACSWIPWSLGFSLRTLLLAITLLCVLFGFVAWSMR